MQSVMNPNTKRIRRAATLSMAVLAALLILMNIGHLAGQTSQNAYRSPQDAVLAVVYAVKANDTNLLIRIFGPESEEILRSGDDVADKETRVKFLQKYQEMNRFVTNPGGSVTLYIGAENWPFPIPLVQKNGGWRFATAAGKREILYRRIGRNEFDTIDTLHALVDAQQEYASQPRDGNVKQYAQKLMSDEGKHNGLYWKTGEGEETSPVGPLIADAFGEGYRMKKEGSTPYHGYVYKLLQSQGPGAPGGAKDYMENGKLSRGFAFIAYPVEYRNSGVMTFIVNQDGKVYQKDLGAKTESLAPAITAYNPDKTWQLAE